jgi:hypothetical protein
VNGQSVDQSFRDSRPDRFSFGSASSLSIVLSNGATSIGFSNSASAPAAKAVLNWRV